MKRISILVIVCIAFRIALIGQTTFQQANQLYAGNHYAQAIELYQQIIDSAQAAPSAELAEVYYNLGNAYYKQGELALSILSYERALRLNPSLDDAAYNLKIAQSRITDNIVDSNSFFIAKWVKAIRDSGTKSFWLWLSVVCFIVCLSGILIFLLSPTPWLRKLCFHSAWIVLLITIIAGINAYSLNQRDTLRNEAIITQGIVCAKSSPDQTGTDLFTLHEGTKVLIQEVIGSWCNITVGNYEGWIPTSSATPI